MHGGIQFFLDALYILLSLFGLLRSGSAAHGCGAEDLGPATSHAQRQYRHQ
jgi:hypothetical protein